MKPYDSGWDGVEDAHRTLIAAAPELYEALEALYKQAAKLSDSCAEEALEQARAALAKAGGGQ